MGKPLFFNSVNGDRKYDADDITEWLTPFFTTGVFKGDLQVVANNNMSVTIRTGYCNIGGKVKHFEEETTLDLETASGTLNRIDNVILRRNDTDRDLYLMIQTGGYAATPSAPEITRSGAVYDLKLAEIYVSAGTIKITQADITDCRMDSEVCGWVSSTVDEIPFDQIKIQFDDWFAKMKEQFSDDAVGALQSAIDAAGKKLETIEEGANKTVVDLELSSSSENPLQNKAIAANLTSRTKSIALDTAGWYRIARYTGGAANIIGASDNSCKLVIKRSYSSTSNEHHEVELLGIYNNLKFRNIADISNMPNITQVRYVTDTDGYGYFEIYYNANTANSITIILKDIKSVSGEWVLISPEPATTTETVKVSMMLPQNSYGETSKLHDAVKIGNADFNGTTDITLEQMGAAPSSHTHNYAPSSHTHNYAGSSSAGGAADLAKKLESSVLYEGQLSVSVAGGSFSNSKSTSLRLDTASYSRFEIEGYVDSTNNMFRFECNKNEFLSSSRLKPYTIIKTVSEALWYMYNINTYYDSSDSLLVINFDAALYDLDGTVAITLGNHTVTIKKITGYY